MNNKKLSICVSVLNIIGIICLIYFAILYLETDTGIPLLSGYGRGN